VEIEGEGGGGEAPSLYDIDIEEEKKNQPFHSLSARSVKSGFKEWERTGKLEASVAFRKEEGGKRLPACHEKKRRRK